MSIQRSLGLDLARAIAIFSVIAAHTTSLKVGAFGVQLFFVISGYLLADFRSQFTSKNFLLHRFLRLAPLAWVSILIFHFRFNSATELALNLLLLQSLFLNMNSFPGGWSISFEWLFSIFNLFLVRFTKAFTVFLFLSTVLMQISIYLYEVEITNINLTVLPIAIIIANLGFFICGNLIRRGNLKVRRIYLVVLAVGFLPLLSVQPPYFLSALNIFIVCLFLLCLDFQTKHSFIAVAISFIGRRTYGIFLGHFVVLIGIGNIHFFQNFRGELGVLNQLIHFLIVGVGGVFIGVITYKFIEKPLLNLSSNKLRNAEERRP